MVRARFSYPDAMTIRVIFETLAKVADETSIEVMGDGLVIRVMDPAQVAYAQVELPSTVFIEFMVEEPGDFGLLLTPVNRVLRSARRGYRLDAIVDGDEVRLAIVGGPRRTFVFRAMAVPKPEVTVEPLPFESKATVLVEPFKNALKDLEMVATKVVIQQNDAEALVIQGAGESKYTLNLSRSSGAVLDMVGEGRISSSFNIDYLVNMLPLLRVADTVTIELMNSGPLKLTVDIPTGGRVVVLLAPYIG